LIAETLLAAAFNAIACQSRVLTLLRRVYSGSYDRLTAANPPESHPPSGATPENVRRRVNLMPSTR
jgi:hypothetical protein